MACGQLRSGRVEIIQGGGLVHIAKRLIALVGAGAVVLSLASCAAPRGQGGPDPTLRGQWQLKSASDSFGPIALANQLISLTIDGDSTTSGRSSCSDYTAHIYGTVSTLWVTATVPHAETCVATGQKYIEHRYLKDLNQVRTSTVTGGMLHLLGPDIDLKYHRSLAVPLDLVLNHAWKLTSVTPDGFYPSPTVLPEARTGANLLFSAHGFLIGETRCNLFTANYVENAGEVVTTRLVQHSKPGCDAAAQYTDARVMSVLTSGFTFFSGLGVLSITSPRAGLSLSFIDSDRPTS